MISSLEGLIQLHERLLDISEQKTKVIKDGATEELQKLLLKERKEARLLEQMEKKRQAEVEEWFLQRKPGHEATMTNMLKMIPDQTERKKLGNATTKLTELITKLKQQEELNMDLLNQSMKFVQLTMAMVDPSIKEINYGKQKETTNSGRHSVFDSRA
jgi:flagellar biosynthesis/type III secretory pathway chaperone